MKTVLCVIACALPLAACNKGPQVDVKNANANQVAEAVKQSGVMNSNVMVEPGLWESKVTVLDMNIPGLPPQFAAKMKERMAERRNEGSRHCITAEDVKKPKEDFFGADKSCHYEHFTMGGGKIDIQMACKEGGGTQNTTMSGTYTPTNYAMDVSANASGGETNGMTMKMHVDSQRVGECTGKDED